MAILVAVLSVAFADFCIWLGVRIVNRRERWATWTAVMLVVGWPVSYLLSIGPVARVYKDEANAPDWILKAYQPFD